MIGLVVRKLYVLMSFSSSLVSLSFILWAIFHCIRASWISIKISTNLTSSLLHLPIFVFFARFGRCLSIVSRSAKISSVLIISTSLIGLTSHSTWTTSLSLKCLKTCTIASHSLMCERNLFPNHSPLLAPFTSPAISTNSILEYIFFFE